MKESDIIVIGAGAAGLAAAGELGRQGWRVAVLEARARIGGRVMSAAPAGWPRPVELGAEFLHGGSRTTRKLLERARLPARPVDVAMWWHEDGVLRPVPDFWERIGRVADRIPRLSSGGSFRQFLRKQRGRISEEDARFALHYVGGFNAAPLDKISAPALRAARAGADTEDFKIDGRYDALMRELRRAWPAGRVRLHLRTEVRRIEWRRGAVVVRSAAAGDRADVAHRARGAVITLPLGVLQAGRVAFSPPLKRKQAVIARLGWGHAVRLTLRFRPGFWSAPFMPAALGARQGKAFGFVNAPGQPVPVWWALSSPAPVLTGWAGGEAAQPLIGRTERAVRAAALASLADIFGVSPARLRRWFAGACFHDWSRDPFALGAYSFPAAGFEDGAERLAEPVGATLFFAGEATAAEGGTVHGAIESGLRAAREAAKALE